MRILLDPEIFTLQKFGGISRYAAEIIHFLSTQDSIELICPIYFTNNLHLRQNRISHILKGALPTRIKGYLKRKGKREFEKNLESGNFDILVSTYYTQSLVSYQGNKPLVLTVYDMIHELYPELEQGSSIIEDKRILMEKASKIIAISENTKNDILKFYPQISKEKIEVVYLSHSLEGKSFDTKSFSTIDLESPYLLFVGNRAFYKNFKWFIHSIQGWLKENKIPLLCLGGGGFSEEEEKELITLGLENLVRQYSFKDQELYTFYNKAFAFVFPSEYEGFGIPVLEAMYAKCPVILPNHSSFPEVAGSAGIYFDLKDSSTLVARLDDLMKSETFRKGKIKEGTLQVEKFSWEKTARECLSVYQSVDNK